MKAGAFVSPSHPPRWNVLCGHHGAAATHHRRTLHPWGRCCGPVDGSQEDNYSQWGTHQQLQQLEVGRGAVPPAPACRPSLQQHSPSPRPRGRGGTESVSAPLTPASYSPRFYPPKCGKAQRQRKWLQGEKPQSLSHVQTGGSKSGGHRKPGEARGHPNAVRVREDPLPSLQRAAESRQPGAPQLHRQQDGS